MCGNFYEKTVIVGGYLCTCVGISAVQTYTESASGPICGHLSGIRGKIVLRVLCGYPALDGISMPFYILLLFNPDLRSCQGLSLSNEYLSTDNINICDHLCDCVFHLNPGIHLDKIISALPVHQKLYRPRIYIPNFFCYFHCVFTDFFPYIL